MKLKLLKLAASKTQLVFQLLKTTNTGIKKTFTIFANNEYKDEFEPLQYEYTDTYIPIKYNKNCLYTKDEDKSGKKEPIYNMYYNMYDSKLPFYKSAIYKKDKSLRQDNTYDFQDITSHKLSSDLMDIVQVDNIIYSMELKNVYGRYELTCDIWSWLSTPNGYELPPVKKIDTVIYDRDYIEKLLAENLSVDSDKAIKKHIDCIQYNMLYEINGNIYNDYESGNIATNTFKGKNLFDCVYDMCHDDNSLLSNARDYVSIDKCNNLVYLKYYDTIYYDNDNNMHDSRLSGILYNGNRFGFKYLNIEMILTVNRYESFDGHKSNLYSIVINTDILDSVKKKYALTSIITDSLIENISFEIKNCVRSISESILPAHTQLYNVYVNGK